MEYILQTNNLFESIWIKNCFESGEHSCAEKVYLWFGR